MKKLLFICIFMMASNLFSSQQLALKSHNQRDLALQLLQIDKNFNDLQKYNIYIALLDLPYLNSNERFMLECLIKKITFRYKEHMVFCFTGTLCSGKSTIIDLFEKDGYPIMHEVAGDIIAQELKKEEKLQILPWLGDEKRLQFQENVARTQLERELMLRANPFLFLDRGMPDGLAYLVNAGKDEEKLDRFKFIYDFIQRNLYSIVFYFEPTDNLETTEIRTENDYFRQQIARQIRAIYDAIGYRMVIVPLLSIQQRFDFVKMFVPNYRVKFKTFQMHPSGHKEDLEKGYVKNYYDFTMKMKSLLLFREGLFVDIFGDPIHTLKNISCDSGLNIDGGYAKFTMDEFGNIFINNETHQVKHSYFLSGLPAATAGWMKIIHGMLIDIIHDSGHYRPRLFQNLQMIMELTSRGVEYIDIKMFYNDFLGHKFMMVNKNNIGAIKDIYCAA